MQFQTITGGVSLEKCGITITRFFFYRCCVCSVSFHPGSVFHGINDGTCSQRTEADTRASQKSESVPKWPGKVNDKVWL